MVLMLIINVINGPFLESKIRMPKFVRVITSESEEDTSERAVVTDKLQTNNIKRAKRIVSHDELIEGVI